MCVDFLVSQRLRLKLAVMRWCDPEIVGALKRAPRSTSTNETETVVKLVLETDPNTPRAALY